MRSLIFIAILFSTNLVYAQKAELSRTGFYGGISAGGGANWVLPTGEKSTFHARFSLPNLKLGYFLNEQTLLLLHIPGGTYNYKQQTRAFEAVTLGAQQWVGNQFYLNGGAGLALDVIPVWEVDFLAENPLQDFHTGPAVYLGGGYEIYQTAHFSIDLQTRIIWGYSINKINNKQLMAFDLVLGVNWY